MYYSHRILYSNREGKKLKEIVPLQIVEPFVLLRTQGGENNAWDDYQVWLKWKGSGLFSLSLSAGERAFRKSIQAAWPGLRSREAGRWWCRLEKLLADGMDYLSNKDTFGYQC